MVCRPDEAVALHAFDPLRGGVVAATHLALQPAGAGFLAFEHQLADLAVLAFLGGVAGGVDVVEAETAVLGFLGDRIDVFGAALLAPEFGDALDFLVAYE